MQEDKPLSMPKAFIGGWTEIANHAKGFKIFITAVGHFDYRDSKNRPENKQYASYSTYKVIHIANDKDVYFMLRTENPGLNPDYRYERLHYETYTDPYFSHTQLLQDECHTVLTEEMWNTYSNARHWKILSDSLTKDSPDPQYNENAPCEIGGSMTRYSVKH